MTAKTQPAADVLDEDIIADEDYVYRPETAEGLVEYIWDKLRDAGRCLQCHSDVRTQWNYDIRNDLTLIVWCNGMIGPDRCDGDLARVIRQWLQKKGVQTPVRLVHRPHFKVEGNASLELVPRATTALVNMDGAFPVVFRYDDGLVTVQRDGKITGLDVSALTQRLADVAVWSDSRGKRINPPNPVAGSMIDQAATLEVIPILERVVTVPTVGRDGEINTVPGYVDGTYCAPVLPDLEVPEDVDADDVQAAVDYLLTDLLGDFPFVDDADRAHALAVMLQPFVRELIEGPTPMFVIEAPVRGTGKSLLATCLPIPATGAVQANPWPDGDNEQRKSITTLLRENAPVVLWDNVRGTVQSEALEAVLTAWPSWRDRVLGLSKSIDATVTQTWLMTANNLHIGGDLIRRVVKIRLDAHHEQPHHRTGPQAGQQWKHEPLLGWANEHRTDLVRACLVLCKWWRMQGSPSPVVTAEHTMGGYEAWQQVMGGILTAANVSGFLGNVTELDDTDEELTMLTEWLAALGKEFGDDSFSATEALDRLPELWQRLGVSGASVLGRMFSTYKNRPAGGNQLCKDEHRGHSLWRTEATG